MNRPPSFLSRNLARLFDQPHRHRALFALRETVGWAQCVAPDLCTDQRAHGGVVHVDYCRCGAVRYTEVNGGRKLRSPWRDK